MNNAKNKNMPLTIDGYCCKLINKILFAGSQEDVQRSIDAAVKGLKDHKVNEYIIDRFVDRAIQSLNDFNPFDNNAQQWSNIQMGKIVFNRIKSSATSNNILNTTSTKN
jgi:hypothetical protein